MNENIRKNDQYYELLSHGTDSSICCLYADSVLGISWLQNTTLNMLICLLRRISAPSIVSKNACIYYILICYLVLFKINTV